MQETQQWAARSQKVVRVTLITMQPRIAAQAVIPVTSASRTEQQGARLFPTGRIFACKGKKSVSSGESKASIYNLQSGIVTGKALPCLAASEKRAGVLRMALGHCPCRDSNMRHSI